MPSGYVLGFSNRTFEEFFREVVGIQINDSRYNLGTGSKANRMRAFWQIATDGQIRAMLQGLLEAWDLYAGAPIPDSAKNILEQTLTRLGGVGGTSAPLPHNASPSRIAEAISSQLSSQLLEVSKLPVQKRGYEFERFLKRLFDAYNLSARASFRLTGEQIDGSFLMQNETYLLEAKWQDSPTGAADLHTFEGKLGQKASWSRGLFVSISGFSIDGLQAFGRGKRLVCMCGFDLSELLRLRLSIVDVLTAKVRSAAEIGSPYSSVRDLLINGRLDKPVGP